ncbi:MAG: hypothetical protein K0S14_2580 [Thermomicrobiales bacterium]|jgi:hypothetical protein|nr:hypothetical protein [Thermomicrobiales bacterium]MCD6058499.1 hypothetical protein [Thermomicrobiales bacterium]
MVVNTERVDIAVTERDVLVGDEVAVAKLDGPLAAALLAAGIGSFALGLFTTLAEASTAFRERLILDAGVGPLSGKTVWATVVFIIAWAVLAARLRNRDGLLRSATTIFVVLTVLGLLGTFPIFFQAFAPE